MAIVLAARLIPRLKNVHINACVNALAAAIACFFPRSAVITEPSELLFTIIASLAAGIFAACVTYLNGAEEFDICEPKCCALAAVITALAFMSLGTLDYPAINVGRIALGFMLLTLLSYKGTAYGALLGASALVGLCAVDADIGRQAAPLCIAAFASGALSRFGKLTRAVGFVFMGCLAALIGGIDGGGWAILTETITAGALFAALPVKRLFKSDSAFSDDAVAMIMRERLCFAADAVSGIGTGLNAAAETLDRKYSSTLEQAAERAADRSCKTCPNSMICWGQKYELFRGEFERLMKELRAGAEPTELSMNGECGELCANKGAVIRAVGAEYNRYVAAAADSRRIKELRRIYTDHLSEMHDILREMGAAQSGFPKSGEMNACRSAERHIGEILCENGMSDVRVFVYSDNGRISIEAYGEGEPKTDREYLGQLFMSAVGKELELPEISDNCGRCRITARERTALSAQIGVYQLCRGKNRVCGDCCESFTDPRGALYIVLSDGMGSGSRARIDSAMVCSVMARLLKGGVPLPAALETVNTTLMVKSADESFATLDICRIDLNSGECIVYKAGAATTYIKSANRLIRVALSSPPAGTGGKLTVPAQKFTVSPGDRIIMTTDGASLDEEWLARELSSELSAKELSEEIARAARGAENGREDDISVVAVEVGK
jgi:stage II sporulation protein E